MINKLSRVGVGVAGLCENKANSAQFQVKMPTGAELGNFIDIFQVSDHLEQSWGSFFLVK